MAKGREWLDATLRGAKKVLEGLGWGAAGIVVLVGLTVALLRSGFEWFRDGPERTDSGWLWGGLAWIPRVVTVPLRMMRDHFRLFVVGMQVLIVVGGLHLMDAARLKSASDPLQATVRAFSLLVPSQTWMFDEAEFQCVTRSTRSLAPTATATAGAPASQKALCIDATCRPLRPCSVSATVEAPPTSPLQAAGTRMSLPGDARRLTVPARFSTFFPDVLSNVRDFLAPGNSGMTYANRDIEAARRLLGLIAALGSTLTVLFFAGRAILDGIRKAGRALWRATSWNHVVILGDTLEARLYQQDLKRRSVGGNKRILIVAEDVTAERIDTARLEGRTLYRANVEDPAALRKFRPHLARHVISFIDNDERQIAIAAALAEAVRPHLKRRPLGGLGPAIRAFMALCHFSTRCQADEGGSDTGWWNRAWVWSKRTARAALGLRGRVDPSDPLDLWLRTSSRFRLRQLEESSALKRLRDRIQVRFFSENELAARHLVETARFDEVALVQGHEHHRYIIHGGAGEGLAVASEILRQCLPRSASSGLTIIFVGSDAHECARLFRDARSSLADPPAVGLNPVTIDARTTTWSDHLQTFTPCQDSTRKAGQIEAADLENATAHIVCFPVAEDRVAYAFALRRFMLGASPKGANTILAPVFVRLQSRSGMADAVVDALSGVQGYGAAEHIYSGDMIACGFTEAGALEANVAYQSVYSDHEYAQRRPHEVKNWYQLDPFLRESNREQVRHLATKLRGIGLTLAKGVEQPWKEFALPGTSKGRRPRISPGQLVRSTEQLALADFEHRRWVAVHVDHGHRRSDQSKRLGRLTDARLHESLVPFDHLKGQVKELDTKGVIHEMGRLALMGGGQIAVEVRLGVKGDALAGTLEPPARRSLPSHAEFQARGNRMMRLPVRYRLMIAVDGKSDWMAIKGLVEQTSKVAQQNATILRVSFVSAEPFGNITLGLEKAVKNQSKEIENAKLLVATNLEGLSNKLKADGSGFKFVDNREYIWAKERLQNRIAAQTQATASREAFASLMRAADDRWELPLKGRSASDAARLAEEILIQFGATADACLDWIAGFPCTFVEAPSWSKALKKAQTSQLFVLETQQDAERTIAFAGHRDHTADPQQELLKNALKTQLEKILEKINVDLPGSRYVLLTGAAVGSDQAAIDAVCERENSVRSSKQVEGIDRFGKSRTPRNDQEADVQKGQQDEGNTWDWHIVIPGNLDIYRERQTLDSKVGDEPDVRTLDDGRWQGLLRESRVVASSVSDRSKATFGDWQGKTLLKAETAGDLGYAVAAEAMLNHADVVLVAWDGDATKPRPGGTAWTVAEAMKRRLPVYWVPVGRRGNGPAAGSAGLLSEQDYQKLCKSRKARPDPRSATSCR